MATKKYLYELLDEYQAKFDDQFPMMALLGYDVDEIVENIEDCLKKNEPYKYEEDVFH